MAGPFWQRTGLDILIFDAIDGSRLFADTPPTDPRVVAWMPDSSRFFVGNADGSVSVWLNEKYAEEFRVELHQDAVAALAVSPDGERLVSVSESGEALLWQFSGTADPRPIDGHDGPVRSVAFTPDGNLLTGSEDGTARLWDIETLEELGRLGPHGRPILALDFTPDGRQLLSAASDPVVRLWNAETGQAIQRYVNQDTDTLTQTAAVSPDGTRVAVGDLNGALALYELETGSELWRTESPGGVLSVAFSNDGASLFVGVFGSQDRIIDANTGQRQSQFLGHVANSTDADYSPNDAFIATISTEGAAQVWNAQTGQEMRRFVHPEKFLTIRFSPDGSQLLTASEDGVARIWDAEKATPSLEIPGDGSAIIAAEFLDKGNVAVTVDFEGNLSLWSLADGTQIGETVPFSGDGANTVAISDDGTKLALGTFDGRPVIFDVTNRTLGPPLWSLIAGGLGVALLILGGFRVQIAIRKASEEEDPALEPVFSADTPLTDPAFAGETLNALCTKIASFLLNPKTGAPLTLALTGDWGRGKSSAMKLIERQLEAEGNPVIWFNAWHHQKEEHLFAALMEEVGRRALPGIGSWAFFKPVNILARLNLLMIRLRARPLRFVLITFLVVLLLFLIQNVSSNGLDDAEGGGPKLVALVGVLGLSFAVISNTIAFVKPFQATGAALLAQARGFWGVSRFSDKLSFRDQFSRSFREVTQALGKRRLTIMIDDLDRCDVDQVVDIMEALNFLTTSGECYIILGIHENPVRHALGLNKSDLARAHAIARHLDSEITAAEDEDPVGLQKERDAYADFYMEKLLNLRIAIPEFDGEAMNNFIERRVEGRMPDPPAERWRRALIWLRGQWTVGQLAINIAALAGVVWIARMLGLSETLRTFVTAVMGAVFPDDEGEAEATKEPAPEPTTEDAPTETPATATTPPSNTVEVPVTGDQTTPAPEPTATPQQVAQAPAQEAEETARPFLQGIVEQPGLLFALLVAVVALWPLGNLAGRIYSRIQRRAEEAQEALGRRDTQVFRDEIEKSLPMLQRADMTPRVLMRFLNLARFMTAGLGPEEADKIRAFVRLVALELASGGTVDIPASTPEDLRAAMMRFEMKEKTAGDLTLSEDHIGDFQKERSVVSL